MVTVGLFLAIVLFVLIISALIGVGVKKHKRRKEQEQNYKFEVNTLSDLSRLVNDFPRVYPVDMKKAKRLFPAYIKMRKGEYDEVLRGPLTWSMKPQELIEYSSRSRFTTLRQFMKHVSATMYITSIEKLYRRL